MTVIVSAIFRLRRDTAANWTSINPVLSLAEPGLETDTRLVKYGDGSTAWNSLAYSGAALDALLTSIAGLTFGADSFIYGTGSDTAAAGTITAFGRSLVDDADASTARSTLGLGTAAVKNTGTSGDAVPILNGAATTWAAGATFGGDLQINNATYLRGKIAAGTTTRMIGINGSDTCFVGSVDATIGSISFVGSGTFATMTSTGFNLPTGSIYRINNVQLVTSRRTGWTAATGTAARGTFATYTSPTISNPPTQAEVQAIADAVQVLSQRMKAVIDDLITHGLIGT